ncbi:Two pore potassium channel c [Symbiodinium microadriaticum]|uniref:Two pore potassium channel c n=1 Tax=Symbiodinium microadriaticum TaxID=2951 RepID=A0A1Q9CI54_SYMMI|nr:Two pore potassium channel c [Symbiodinium microadriaticum]
MEQPLLPGKKKGVRKRTKDDFKAKLPLVLRYPKLFNLFCVAVYFAVGFLVLSSQEDWEPSTVLYVVAQIVTTIGYGDVTVHHGGKVFMTLYVLLGILLVADAINNFFDTVLDKAETELEDVMKNVESAVGGSAPDTFRTPSPRHQAWLDLTIAAVTYAVSVLIWVAFFSSYERCTCVVAGQRLPGCVEEDCEATGGQKLTVVDATYMAVITFSTVGFGDFTPSTYLGRILGSVWMVVGTLAFANLVGAVSKVLRGKRQEYFKKCVVTRDMFKIIDEDGSGKIDRLEFHNWVLVREGKVARETLEQIDKLFDSLDKDGSGRLSFDEINGKFEQDPAPNTGFSWAKDSSGGIWDNSEGLSDPWSMWGTKPYWGSKQSESISMPVSLRQLSNWRWDSKFAAFGEYSEQSEYSSDWSQEQVLSTNIQRSPNQPWQTGMTMFASLPSEPREILVVNSKSSGSYESLCRDSQTADVVAFDSEWVPDFGYGSDNPISVLQLAFPSSQRVYVVQLGPLGKKLPQEVQLMLVNPDVLKAGFAVNSKDAQKLMRTGIAVTQGSVVDVQETCASRMGLAWGSEQSLSLRRAASTLLRCELLKDKRCACSDWSSEHLTPEQVHYAGHVLELKASFSGQDFEFNFRNTWPSMRGWHFACTICFTEQAASSKRSCDRVREAVPKS